MRIYQYENSVQIKKVLQRPHLDRSRIEKIVRPILERVKKGGDRILFKYALEYDQVKLDDLWVEKKSLETSGERVSESLKSSIDIAKRNIEKFHRNQLDADFETEIMPGVNCSRKSIPIERVGLYIPGGTAPLFSTVLMLGIPAIIAGCDEIVLATPTNKIGEVNDVVLYTAHLLGIKKVLKLGGAQAIGAMAFGTESVPKVDKILGPGNQYVTVAKQIVSQETVSIDMPAGPSEVMVAIDSTSKSSFVAADLLAQAEHGGDSQVILVSLSKKKAEKVLKQIDSQLEELPRKDIAKEALKNSIVILVKNHDQMLEVINEYGAEHLIINLQDEQLIVDGVKNAGSVFIGPHTPESVGDYASGTNHTLPTGGWAKSYSGVSVDSFVKKITYQKLTKQGLELLGPTVETLAEAESLQAHKHAVSIRLKSK